MRSRIVPIILAIFFMAAWVHDERELGQAQRAALEAQSKIETLEGALKLCKRPTPHFITPKGEKAVKNLMVDLETRGNKPGCMLLSIGAVFFDPVSGSLGEKFYTVVNKQSQEGLFLHEDPKTMEWWQQCSLTAQEVLTLSQSLETSVPLDAALDSFTEFAATSSGGLGSVQIWGNGSDFDNAILTVAYMALGREVPWKFWNNRCFRTLKALTPEVPMLKNLTVHNALDDAVMQAEHAVKVFKHLRGETKAGGKLPLPIPGSGRRKI